MAIIRVDSTATGANDGTSWTDAYTSIASAFGDAGLSPDDFIYVDDGHSQTLAASTLSTHAVAPIGTIGEPVKIICVDKAGDTPSTGAVINCSGTLGLEGRQYWYGCTISANGEIEGDNNGADIVLENCVVSPTTDFEMSRTASVTANWVWKNVTFTPQGVGCYLRASNSAYLTIIGGTLSSNVTNLTRGGAAVIRVRGMNLSALTGTLHLGGSNQSGFVDIQDCLLNASTTFFATAPQGSVVLSVTHCQAGTDSDPTYQMYYGTQNGDTQIDTTRYRTGGASDGERTNPFSLSMTSVSGCIERYRALESMPFGARWCGGDGATSYTATILFASGATLQDNQFWIELMRVNDAATNSLGVISTNRLAVLGTPSNLTSDGTSTWNGTDVTTAQQIDLTFTPDKPGWIVARAYLAKSAERVSIDPHIYLSPEITSNARDLGIPGYGMAYEGNAPVGGGGAVFGGGIIR